MREHQPAVYLLSNKRHGTLYTGVTSNLPGRIWQHKNLAIDGFASKYKLTKLVYFEVCENMYQAITREKQIKAGSRKKKLMLIRSMNSEWRDLYEEVCG